MPLAIAIRQAKGDAHAMAVLAILLTVSTLSLSDALVKVLSAGFPLWQIFTLRSALAVPLLVLIIVIWGKGVRWWPKNVFWVTVRSCLMVGQGILYYIALPKVALSAVAATNYTMPLFVSVFAAIFWAEKISPKAWIAVGLGFTGVLLIVQPATEAFNAFALLPLGSAVMVALANLLTKAKCRDEHPLVISLNLNIALLVTGALGTFAGLLVDTGQGNSQFADYLLGRWSVMGLGEWIAIVTMAVGFVVASVCAALAYQLGRPTTIATLDFTYIAFALMWGLIFFGEMPNSVALLGIGTIVFAGVIVVRQTGQRVRSPTR